MSQRASKQHGVDAREQASELLRGAEFEAEAGRLPQAAALLTELWTVASDGHADLANIAAWEQAWLALRMGAYTDAALWFERVVEPPRSGSGAWPEVREAVIELCRARASEALRSASHDTTPSSSSNRRPARLPELEVRSLGALQILRDGIALPFNKARKAAGLFRFLLAQPQRAAGKEELMELLWPDTPPAEARHSLHVAVGSLRRHLDPGGDTYICYEGGRYFINPAAHVTYDCGDFREHVRAADQAWRESDLRQAGNGYLAAIADYRGDYVIDDSSLTWELAERERLLAVYLSALDHLARVFMAQGALEQAVDYLDRLLDRDPYREDVHSQIMHCYWRLGRRAEALRQYEICASVLGTDLGIEPMPETQAVYRAILDASTS